MDILQNITEAWQAMQIIEVIGVLTGIVNVWLAARQHIWTWPVGLVSVAMYVLVFYDARLYADMGLNVFYFVTSLYGWYIWLYGGTNHTGRKVGHVRKKEMAVLLGLGAVFTLALGYFLDNYTNADLSYADAGTTAIRLPRLAKRFAGAAAADCGCWRIVLLFRLFVKVCGLPHLVHVIRHCFCDSALGRRLFYH